MVREPGWLLLSSGAPDARPPRWCPVGPRFRLDASRSLHSLLVLCPKIWQRTAPSHQPSPEAPLYWPPHCALPSDLFLAHPSASPDSIENLKLFHGSLLPSDITYSSWTGVSDLGPADLCSFLLPSAPFCPHKPCAHTELLVIPQTCHLMLSRLISSHVSVPSAWNVRFGPSPLSELGPPSVIPCHRLGHTAGSGQGPQLPHLLTVQRRPGTEQGLVNGSVGSWGHLFQVWSTLPVLNLWLR